MLMSQDCDVLLPAGYVQDRVLGQRGTVWVIRARRGTELVVLRLDTSGETREGLSAKSDRHYRDVSFGIEARTGDHCFHKGDLRRGQARNTNNFPSELIDARDRAVREDAQT